MKRLLLILALAVAVLAAAPVPAGTAATASDPYQDVGGFRYVLRPNGIIDVYQWDGLNRVWVYLYSTVAPVGPAA